MGIVRGLLRRAGDFLVPPLCPGCREELSLHPEKGPEDPLCPACAQALLPLPQERCALCGAPLDTVLELCRECAAHRRPWCAGTCAFPYDGPAGNWIRALKYGRETAFAPLLGRAMAEAWRSHHGEASLQPDLVVPIPLHWRRLGRRGFNQAALLARHVARALECPWGEPLRRGRPTAHQARLKGAGRLRNLRHAFQVPRPGEVRGKSILVVDDVMTTGATLEAACLALLAAGAAQTAVLAAARA